MEELNEKVPKSKPVVGEGVEVAGGLVAVLGEKLPEKEKPLDGEGASKPKKKEDEGEGAGGGEAALSPKEKENADEGEGEANAGAGAKESVEKEKAEDGAEGREGVLKMGGATPKPKGSSRLLEGTSKGIVVGGGLKADGMGDGPANGSWRSGAACSGCGRGWVFF